jgi:P27 family predicted phage terminase small subunit
MPRGPKPKPVAIHKLQGSYQRVRHAKRAQEPHAEGALAECAPPEWMTADQQRIWREVIAEAPKGILRQADRRMMINYVVLADRFETAARTQIALDAKSTAPLLVRGAAGTAISPYVRIMNQCTALMTQLQGEMAFSPSGRARLGQPQAPGLDEAAYRRFEVIAPDGTRTAYEGSRSRNG